MSKSAPSMSSRAGQPAQKAGCFDMGLGDGTKPQERIYRGIRLNDEIAPKVYRLDPWMVELGCEGLEALERDASGWPIPRSGAECDFPD